MNEDFLYYIWLYKLFSKVILFTTDSKEIHVKKTGIQNKNSGPDFLNAHLEIDNQLWVGNVEMHLKSSDWYLHKHEEDVNYDAVILHVVWEHDCDIFMSNNKPLPTLVLKEIVDMSLLTKYNLLTKQTSNWIPCEPQINTVDNFLIDNWLERLYFERLEQKSIFIKKQLEESNYDFEAVLFQLLAKNFGLKINGEAFLQLAKSIDFTLVKKVSFNENQLNALFFGQAGFLEEEFEEFYHQQLRKEYNYLKHKFSLHSMQKNTFHFFRMRPNNFPTIRIAQLAALFCTHQNLFSKLMNITKKEEFYSLFSTSVNEFWKTHYTFEKASKKSAKKLSKSFIDLLLINTILPLKFVFSKYKNEFKEDSFIELIQQIQSEKNSVINSFHKLKIKSKNALESQALLELKNHYCTKKRCLHCAIGINLLKN